METLATIFKRHLTASSLSALKACQDAGLKNNSVADAVTGKRKIGLTPYRARKFAEVFKLYGEERAAFLRAAEEARARNGKESKATVDRMKRELADAKKALRAAAELLRDLGPDLSKHLQERAARVANLCEAASLIP